MSNFQRVYKKHKKQLTIKNQEIIEDQFYEKYEILIADISRFMEIFNKITKVPKRIFFMHSFAFILKDKATEMLLNIPVLEKLMI